MADEQFTEADVRSIATVLHDARTVWVRMDDGHLSSCPASGDDLARAALRALAEAGRLLPAGLKITEEIAVSVDVAHPRRSEKVGDILTHLGDEKSRRAKEVWHGWTPVKRFTASTPWVPVGTTEEPTDAAL